MPDDVWSGYSRVCGTFKERAGWHPCQMPESLLKRIIAASSNPDDCVLDPFSGSGTTAAAAYQLGRSYVGIEISEEYVENSKKRLAQLKQQSSRDLFLDVIELDEIKRLSIDIRKTPKEIVSDKELLKLFANQFAVRMNNRKKYNTKVVAVALEGLTG
jgi:site-specific DNA-methyltransferase (adenine-specific)